MILKGTKVQTTGIYKGYLYSLAIDALAVSVFASFKKAGSAIPFTKTFRHLVCAKQTNSIVEVAIALASCAQFKAHVVRIPLIVS